MVVLLVLAPAASFNMFSQVSPVGTAEAASTSGPEVKWETNISTDGKGVQHSRSAIGPNNVYFVSNKTIYAIDRTNGNVVWKYRNGTNAPGSIDYTNGKLVAGIAGVGVLALDASDGSKLWVSGNDGDPNQGAGVHSVGVGRVTGEIFWVHDRDDTSTANKQWSLIAQDGTVVTSGISNSQWSTNMVYETGSGTTQTFFFSGYRWNSNGVVHYRDGASAYGLPTTSTRSGVVENTTGRFWYGGGPDDHIVVEDATDGSRVANITSINNSNPTLASPSSNTTVLAGDGTTLRVFNKSGGNFSRVGLSDTIQSIETSEEGKYAFVGLANGKVKKIVTPGRSVSKEVSGRVTNQNGQPVSNATVEVVGVDTSKVNASGIQSKKEKAKELLDEASNPFPDGYDFEQQLTGKGGLYSGVKQEVVMVHSTENWALGPSKNWVRRIDLNSPMQNPPAEERVVLSVWNPMSEPTFENDADADHPGKTINRSVQVKQLGPGGSVVDTWTVHLDETRKTGVYPGDKTHNIGVISLPPGVYLLSPEGSSFTLPVVAGDRSQIRRSFATELRNRADSYSNAAERMQERLNSGKFVRLTDTSNATGHYNVSVPANIKVIAVSAYKIDGKALPTMQDPSPSDMRAWVINHNYNGSVAMTLAPRKYEVPTSNADITVREFSSPPYQRLDQWASAWETFRDRLENGTLTDLSGGIYNIPYSQWNKSQLEGGASNLARVIDSNRELINAWEEQSQQQWETFQKQLEQQQATNRELREALQSMEQVLDERRAQLATQSSSTNTNAQKGTVTVRKVFNGDFSEEDVTVIWKDYDGSTHPVPKQYWSVDKHAGQGDEVVVENYPIPNGSAGGTISVLVMSEEGKLGRSQSAVTAPGFTGQKPDIRSVDFSTLQPSTGSDVSVKPHLDTTGVTIEGAQVYHDGSKVSSSLKNGEVTFTPSERGTYVVQFSLLDSSSNKTFVENVRVPVGGTDYNYPSSVAVVKGRLGVMALAGENVDDARVNIEDGGSSITATALVSPDSGTNEVHFYMEDAPTETDQTLTYRVLEGTNIDTATSISRHVGIYVHGRSLANNAVVYRKHGSTKKPVGHGKDASGGSWKAGNNGGAVIHTYSGKNGEVTITVNNDPTWFERQSYELDVWWNSRSGWFGFFVPVDVLEVAVEVVEPVDPFGELVEPTGVGA